MSENTPRALTRKVAEVARRTTAKLAQIVTGTVISRNPDGSLNVDDGRGGCVRMAPAANVRIGQQIKLGTEPELGSQTNLPQVSVTLSGSTVPCPNDWRPACEPFVGNPCPPEQEAVAEFSASRFSVGWVDPPPTMLYAGRRDGVWKNRLSIDGTHAGGPVAGLKYTAGTTGQPQQNVSRKNSAYASTIIPPYADQITFGIERHFMAFDTSSIPPGAEVSSAILKLTFRGNTETRLKSDMSESVVVVPSDHSGVSSTSNFDKIIPVELGRFAINDAIAAGPDPPAGDDPYTYEVDLSATIGDYLGTGEGGVTKLALLMSRDFGVGSVLPAPGPIGETALLVTETSPTPDEVANVSAGDYEIEGIQYVAGTFVFAFSQSSSSGVLSTGESYFATLSLGPSGELVTTKGAKSANPFRPPAPPGQIVIGWVQCLHNGGVTTILNANITQAGARSYTDGGDPNSSAEVLDKCTIYLPASSAVTLTVRYTDVLRGGSRD